MQDGELEALGHDGSDPGFRWSRHMLGRVELHTRQILEPLDHLEG